MCEREPHNLFKMLANTWDSSCQVDEVSIFKRPEYYKKMDHLIKDKIEGMLLSGCIGDVLGLPNEGKSFDTIQKDGLVTRFKTNEYSDDTEMTLIIVRYLNKYYKNGSLIARDIHAMYRDVMLQSKRGYSARTRHILTNWNEYMPSGNADTNGAVMRISPLCVIDASQKPTDENLKYIIRSFLYCTHSENKDAVDVCFIHIKALSAFLQGKHCSNALDLYNYILYLIKRLNNPDLYALLLLINPNNKNVLFPHKNPLTNNITKIIFGQELFQIKAKHCYVCVLICFLYNFDNPKNALIMAANLGNDTDTIAKITGDLVGAKYGTSWIPAEWSNPEGKETIIAAAKEMYDKYLSKQQ